MTLREELDRLYEEHGYLTPALVREAARDEANPMHRFVFGKAPADAAEAWYLHRAHTLICRFKITFRAENGDETRVRRYQAVRGETIVYRASDDVAADPLTSRIVLADMRREWETLKARYGKFDEFTAMIAGYVSHEVA